MSGRASPQPVLCSPGMSPKGPASRARKSRASPVGALLSMPPWRVHAWWSLVNAGHVLLSDDQGRTWRRSQVPTRANLTGVFFSTHNSAGRVGHDEVILRSEDGGETWTRQHYAPRRSRPLLDAWFGDADNGLAFGAYGTILSSHDGGRTWSEQIFEPQPLIESLQPRRPRQAMAKQTSTTSRGAASDMHLNAVAPSADGKLYLAAEAGHLFRSDDNGATWLELPSPYEGSFFGVLPLEPPSLLAFGLRGAPVPLRRCRRNLAGDCLQHHGNAHQRPASRWPKRS